MRRAGIEFRFGLILLLVWMVMTGTAFSQGISGLQVDEGGRVSLGSQQVSVKAFLEELAQKAHIEIFLTDTLEDASKEISFDNTPLHQVLDDLLRETNFAVIYGAAPKKEGVAYIIDDSPNDPRKVDSGPERPLPDDPLARLASRHFNKKSPNQLTAKERRIVRIEGQIERLEKDIESGEADKRYQYWIKRKDPKFVTDPHKQLENYRNRLAKLTSE